MNYRISLLIISTFLLASCAATYKSIDTSKLTYTDFQTIGEFMEIGYKYNIFYDTYNIRYHKKSIKNGYNTIAIEIKNTSLIPVSINTDNFKIFADSNQMQVMDNTLYLNDVKQKPGLFLLYGLLGPWSFQKTTTPDGNTTTKVKFLPIFLAIGLANSIVADKSNKRLEKEILELNIFGKTIYPNETLHGLISIKGDNLRKLTFKYLE